VQYEVEIGGRVKHVSITRTGATFAVTVDGRMRQVDAARIDPRTLSLVVDSVWSKDAIVVSDPASGQLTVTVDGIPVAVTLNGRRRGRRTPSAHAASGPQRVVAPMPGKVVRALVTTGDLVVARQPLLVVEAMKMENELRAGRDGRVAEMHVREGDSVDAGALLLVIQ